MFFLISRNKTPQPDTALQKITITLSKDIANVKGRRSPIDYKMWTKQYPNQFNILDGSITSGKHKTIADLKSGQVCELLISASEYNALGQENKAITIKGIRVDQHQLMSPNEFHKNRTQYKNRIQIFAVFAAIMLMLNGLIPMPKKINYAIIGLFIATIFFMKILGIGFY